MRNANSILIFNAQTFVTKAYKKCNYFK